MIFKKNMLYRNQTKYILGLIVLLVATSLTKCTDAENISLSKPNVIYILADDMGRSDLGIYGQQLIETPHLNRLAAGGMKFTNHYSGSTVCAPSRSALMTGLHTGHTAIRGNKEYYPEGQHPLPNSSFTLLEMMKEAGYTTGVFGKWGLGYVGSEGDPLNQGADYFFGYNCQRYAHRYYPDYLWDNGKKLNQQLNETYTRTEKNINY